MIGRVAVIGASGFIGRHLVPSLVAQGTEVVATARDVARLDHLEGIEKVALDISDAAGAFDRLGRPNVVVHLGWGGLPNYKSLHHFEHELPLQYDFLKQLIVDGASRLVITGTCLEYGMKSGELSELDTPEPTNAYALAKHILHRQLELLQTQLPFELSWCRLFYLYGQGQAPTSLWSSLHAAIERGETRFNMSQGDQLRDFLPIERATELLATISLSHKGLGPINICSGKGISVRALVESWIAAAGSQIVPNLGHYPYPDYEPFAFWGNAEKLHRTTGHS
ncbi:dTDP-6-deoxy-L-talose 4-dehydrogenase (NAD+) [Devosia sp. YR412]|uniref:NAD-dependent epimerase/dehydratase family protein n=1 Tax=Devosia sp. YR412 TaxID=1881030 RepID=UPI0008CBA628|nr:NAD(P)-dependent oxidoreductase [Devosia sp. YR412]SEQ32408.1 dTDP-6-deoxy-L-talose 4-dehydrogenase (NAD+) [Devosia sp. YR412]